MKCDGSSPLMFKQFQHQSKTSKAMLKHQTLIIIKLIIHSDFCHGGSRPRIQSS